MAPIRRRKISISILIPFAIVALLFGAMVWKKMQDSRERQPVPQVGQPASPRKVVLFFATDDARLAREGRELEPCSDTAECVKGLLDELFSGPVGELYEAIPEGAAVNSVRLEGDLAVVDVSRVFASDLPSGSSTEILAVYSIINTVCFNYPQVGKVRITVEGEGKAVLKHLDLSEPLTPDYSLERAETSTTNAAPVATPVPAEKKKGQP